MKVEWRSCFKVGVSVFLLFLAITYWEKFASIAGVIIGAATPLFLGCIIAYIINIMMSFYERHYFPKTRHSGLGKIRRPVCLLAAFLTLLAIIFLVITLVVPELTASIELLIAKIPDVMDMLSQWLKETQILPEDMIASLQATDWESKIEQIISVLTSGLGTVMGTAVNVVSTVFSGIVTAVLALIFSIYVLAGKEKLGSQLDRVMKRYMKASLYGKIRYVLSVMNDSFHKYIVGQCTEAVILGALCAIGMLILRLPYAVMTGVVIAFTALVPVAGAYIGGAVGVLLILTVSPMKAIIFLVFLVVLQQVEGNLIYPRVVGSSMGLPAIWVLAAVTIGGGVMGIAGMLVGVPFAATLYRLLREDVNRMPQKFSD